MKSPDVMRTGVSVLPVYLLTEPFYAESSWCREILAGLSREGRRKRIPLLSLPAQASLRQTPPGAAVILIGSTFSWLQGVVLECQHRRIHPIVLSNQPQSSFEGEYSSVGTDMDSSMGAALQFFRSRGKTRTALYGVNRRSLADIGREKSFCRRCPTGVVFPNDGSLRACFDRFFPQRAAFDSIICTNDFAALSLLRRWRGALGEGAEALPVISYSNTLLAQYFSPAIHSLSMNFGDFGKAALLIATSVQHSYLAGIHIAVRWTLNPRDGTAPEQTAALPDAEPKAPQAEPDSFYADPELQQLLRAEQLLNACDSTDLAILAGLLDGMAYDRIAELCFLSPNGIKYRIRKMMDCCAVRSRAALTAFLAGLIDRGRLTF